MQPQCGSSSVGRARPCQGRGRGFESRLPLQKEILSTQRGFFLEYQTFFVALVVELVDTQDLKSCDHCGRAGSSPARGTIKAFVEIQGLFYFPAGEKFAKQAHKFTYSTH